MVDLMSDVRIGFIRVQHRLIDDAEIVVAKRHKKAFIPVAADVMLEFFFDDGELFSLFFEHSLRDARHLGDNRPNRMNRFDVRLVAGIDFLDGQVIIQERQVGADLNHFVAELRPFQVQKDKRPAVFYQLFKRFHNLECTTKAGILILFSFLFKRKPRGLSQKKNLLRLWIIEGILPIIKRGNFLMNAKIQLTPKQILERSFTANVKGYNSEEVDAYLDLVISDYKAFAQYQQDCAAYAKGLEDKMIDLQGELQATQNQLSDALNAKKSLEIENASMKNRLSGIKPGDKVSSENLEYISRLNRLESFLYSIGYDPKTLKKNS